MSNPIQRMMQMMPQIAQIQNQKQQIELERQRTQSEIEQRNMQTRMLMANSFTGMVQQAGSIAEESRVALAQNYAELAGAVPPEVLARLEKAMMQQPDNSALTASKEAAADAKMYQPARKKIEAAIAEMPDANARDVAYEGVSARFSGQGAGQARASTAAADRRMISDVQVQSATLQRLNLLLSPQQQEEFKMAQTRLQQGWESIGNDQQYREAMLALQAGELDFKKKMTMLAEQGAGAPAGTMITPMKAIENIDSFVKTLNSKQQSGMTKELIASMIHMNLQSLRDAKTLVGDAEGAQRFADLMKLDLTKVGPSGFMQRLLGISSTSTPK